MTHGRGAHPCFTVLAGSELTFCYIRWREKATPYNSQPSRLQNTRHVYNYPSRLQFTTVTSTKQVL